MFVDVMCGPSVGWSVGILFEEMDSFQQELISLLQSQEKRVENLENLVLSVIGNSQNSQKSLPPIPTSSAAPDRYPVISTNSPPLAIEPFGQHVNEILPSQPVNSSSHGGLFNQEVILDFLF
jgi:hypothetical protein